MLLMKLNGQNILLILKQRKYRLNNIYNNLKSLVMDAIKIPFEFGLILIDSEDVDENGELTVLHFVGYEHEPTDEDAEDLRQELLENEDLGFSDVIDELDIAVAPEEVVEQYKEEYITWMIRQN